MPGQSPIVRFGIGVAAFFAVIGGPLSGYFLSRMVLEANASADWPAADGMMTRVEVGKTDVGRFFPDVAYTYQVGTTELTGSRIRATDGEYDFRDGATQAIRGLKVGQSHPVYYNPANPRQSVLQPGTSFQDYALLLFPVGLFVLGLTLLQRLRSTRRKE